MLRWVAALLVLLLISRTGQAADVHLGLTATLTPWPHSRLAPYLLTGVAAVQRWSSGGGAYTNPDGSLAQRVPERAITRGSFAFSTGLGLRVRFGERLVQLEFRRDDSMRDLTLGSALRF